MELSEEALPLGCKIVSLPTEIDDRGCLSHMTLEKYIPFHVERIFWIYGVPEGRIRGGHAHTECAELIIPVCGAFTICVDDGITRATVRMDSPAHGILIPIDMWCQLEDFDKHTVCLVVASHPYNKDGYINDYETYIKYKQCK
jgi:dTDP-4-dehydrorhamnose 3,5-epimerase-like enzyme